METEGEQRYRRQRHRDDENSKHEIPFRCDSAWHSPESYEQAAHNDIGFPLSWDLVRLGNERGRSEIRSLLERKYRFS